MAREAGVSTSGNKAELAARVEAALAGRPLPEVKRRKRTRLEGELTRETVIPEGVVLSRHLREWFESVLGPSFRSDRHLREFLRDGAGRTLGDAVDHYRATRASEPSEIEPQFELNRFARVWWQEHPEGSRAELMEAWRSYRNTPVNRRRMPDGRT